MMKANVQYHDRFLPIDKKIGQLDISLFMQVNAFERQKKENEVLDAKYIVIVED